MVEKPGTLNKHLSQEDKLELRELTLSGNINSDDICSLREMMGTNEMNIITGKGKLEKLFLQDARIINGGDTYFINFKDGLSYKTKKDYINEYMFSNCTSLTDIVLPQSTIGILANAFEGCIRMKSITFPSKTNYIISSAFNNCDSIETIICSSNKPALMNGSVKKTLYKAKLKIPLGSRRIYFMTYPWGFFENIEEFEGCKE